MIKYLGSKRTLIPVILDAVQRVSDAHTIIDLFSGTSRVGHALKRAGYRVLSNDHNAYAATLARCYVQADAEDVLHDAQQLVREFNALKGEPGYFTQTFCEQSRFFQPKNGARIDAIREAIARKCLPKELEAVLLVSLMEATPQQVYKWPISSSGPLAPSMILSCACQTCYLAQSKANPTPTAWMLSPPRNNSKPTSHTSTHPITSTHT